MLYQCPDVEPPRRSGVGGPRRKEENVGISYVEFEDENGVLRRYRKVLVPELNGGQLSLLLRARFLVDCVPLTKVQGRPFLVGEIEQKVEELLA